MCLGIAPNTMLAKVCSDKNKPNGQYTIASSREAVMTFINDLPLKKVCSELSYVLKQQPFMFIYLIKTTTLFVSVYLLHSEFFTGRRYL